MQLCRTLVSALLVVLIFATGCVPQAPGSFGKNELAPAERSRHLRDGDRLNITVSIVPQKYFVERIGGDHVKVSVMVLPGANPATYEPKPEQMGALSRADAYVSIGVPFEKAWMERIVSVNRRMIVVDTTKGIELQPMAERPPIRCDRQGHPSATRRSHKGDDLRQHDDGLSPHLWAAHRDRDEGEGKGENLDPHIWTSPALVKVQLQTIYEALVELDPVHQDDYKANLAGFVADIDRLDADIRETLSGLPNSKFMVFHPSWGYFARDYGLEMVPIEIEGKEPSARELVELIAEAKEEGIRVILAQPEFSTQSAEAIAKEIGGEVLLISPLAEDWLENMRQVASTFAQALGR